MDHDLLRSLGNTDGGLVTDPKELFGMGSPAPKKAVRSSVPNPVRKVESVKREMLVKLPVVRESADTSEVQKMLSDLATQIEFLQLSVDKIVTHLGLVTTDENIATKESSKEVIPTE